MHAESWDFQIGGSMASVPAQSGLQVDAAEAVVEAALAGTGIIRLFSYHVAAAVRAGRLSLLLEQFEPPQLPVNIVYLGGGLLPLKVRAFLDFAAPRLKARRCEPLGEPRRMATSCRPSFETRARARSSG
jgi:DNA-binding transcriptional LysR family regulator